MEPVNTELKISMKMLDAQEAAKTSNVPKASAIPEPNKNLRIKRVVNNMPYACLIELFPCLLYTSPSPRDATLSRMPSSA